MIICPLDSQAIKNEISNEFAVQDIKAPVPPIAVEEAWPVTCPPFPPLPLCEKDTSFMKLRCSKRMRK